MHSNESKMTLDRAQLCAAYAEAGLECPYSPEKKHGEKKTPEPRMSMKQAQECVAYAEAGMECPYN